MTNTLPLCQRQDLSTPALIFGGLLLSLAVVCSTVDIARPVASLNDDVKVLNDEHAIGPAGFDPYALDCRPDSHGRRNVGLVMSKGKATRCTQHSVYVR